MNLNYYYYYYYYLVIIVIIIIIIVISNLFSIDLTITFTEQCKAN